MINTITRSRFKYYCLESVVSKPVSRQIVAERGYYDSLAFVKSLTESGFTQSQAEQLCFLFKDIVNYIAEDIKKECVTKPGQVSFFYHLIH
jgi:hypothetical protein